MKYSLLFILLFTCKFSLGQSNKYSEKDYTKTPVWINMIKDTSVNFFEAEKAFKVYFEHHVKPAGENEDIGEHARRAKEPTKKELKKIEKDNRMRMEIKKYEHWRDMMRTYVQPDGSILTPSQRLLIHQQIINR